MAFRSFFLLILNEHLPLGLLPQRHTPQVPCTSQVPLPPIILTFTAVSLAHGTLSQSFDSIVSAHLKFSPKQLLGLLGGLPASAVQFTSQGTDYCISWRPITKSHRL